MSELGSESQIANFKCQNLCDLKSEICTSSLLRVVSVSNHHPEGLGVSEGI
jgi:hypothetical protein